MLDCAMTYSLFDWMKESADDFINKIPKMEKVKRKFKLFIVFVWFFLFS